MSATTWSDEDTQRVEQIWAEYQGQHDLTTQVGQTAGIDPASGRIWFGESATDIVRQMDAEGKSVPLFFMRIGQSSYLRKGGRR